MNYERGFYDHWPSRNFLILKCSFLPFYLWIDERRTNYSNSYFGAQSTQSGSLVPIDTSTFVSVIGIAYGHHIQRRFLFLVERLITNGSKILSLSHFFICASSLLNFALSIFGP